MTTSTTDHTATVDGYLAAYGEPDPVRRAELIAAAFTADARLVDPPARGEGHDGIGFLGDLAPLEAGAER